MDLVVLRLHKQRKSSNRRQGFQSLHIFEEDSNERTAQYLMLMTEPSQNLSCVVPRDPIAYFFLTGIWDDSSNAKTPIRLCNEKVTRSAKDRPTAPLPTSYRLSDDINRSSTGQPSKHWQAY